MARRILLVDDNPDAVAMLAIALRRAGHEVREATDGNAALAMLPSFKPDFVFLDLGLPGLDGFEVARSIRGNPDMAATRVVALTGQSQQEARDEALLAGIDQFLVKPIDLAFVHSLLGRRERV